MASQLNITERTIRGDIQVINDILEPFQLQINLKRKYGYYLEISNQELYEEFLVQLDSQKNQHLIHQVIVSSIFKDITLS